MTGNQAHEPDKSLRRRLVWLGIAVFGMLLLASAWSWSPLKQWLDVGRAVAALQQMGQSVGPVAAIVGFTLALILAVPLTFLTLVTIVAFGPTAGFFYAMGAAVIGAAVTFLIGKLMGHEVVQRLGGPRVNSISRRLASHGILSVIAIRMVPVAPFAVVNLVAGATHLSLRDLMVGTAIGMTPGTLIMVFFVDQIVEALKNPSPVTWLLLIVMVTLIAAGVWGLRWWLRKTDPAAPVESGRND